MSKKNIVVCSAPRSGSTWFMEHIAKQHPGMINHKESLRTIDPGYDASTRVDSERKSQFKQVIREWHNPNNSNCVKIFPMMLTEVRSPWRKRSFFQDLLNNADEIYYLMRRDFQAQVMSATVAYYKTLMGEVNFHGSWQEPYHIPDDIQSRLLLSTSERTLYSQNYQLLQLWHNTETDVPTKLLFLEDLDQSGKYNRPVTWERQPVIQQVDWEPLFQREL